MRRWLWVSSLLAFVLVVLGAGWGVYQWLHNVQSDANSGKAYLEAGLTSLKAKNADQASQSFQAADTSFSSVQQDLGPSWLRHVPLLGRQLTAVDQLATVGRDGARLGGEASDIVGAATEGSSKGSVNAIIQKTSPHLLRGLDAAKDLEQSSSQLTTDGLVPPVSRAVQQMQAKIDPLRPYFKRLDTAAPLVRYMLTGNHRFLLVSQNNGELRPTGGFMGSYGLLAIGSSGVKVEKYSDIYTLPRYQSTLPAPTGAHMIYKSNRLNLRDANWWLDFPTSARTILSLYDTMTPAQPKVDGVIAIDLITIKTLLGEFGPITLSDYGKTFTADNMIRSLVVMVEEPGDTPVDQRKDVLQPLGEELLHRVTHLHTDQLVPTARLLGNLADEKRIQIYANDAHAQRSVQALGWSGAIAAPAGTTDILGISNAVVFAAKTNLGMQKTVKYQVNLDANGSATSTLTMRYVMSPLGMLANQRQWYGGYVRVYRPAGTQLTGSSSQRSMAAFDMSSREANVKPALVTDKPPLPQYPLPTIGAGFDVQPGETRVETFRMTTPHAIGSGVGPTIPEMPVSAQASVSGSVKHYRLLLVKQPDLEEITTTVSVSMPKGWRIVNATAWQRGTGKTVALTSKDGKVTFQGPLTADTIVNVVVAP